MIAINLLPEAYRKAPPNPLVQFPRSPLALLLAGLLVGLWLLLGVMKHVRQTQVARLTARIEALHDQKQASDELKASVDSLRERQALLQRLDQNRSRWAARLNALSDLVPDGVWLTELSIGQQESPDKVVLRGSAIGRGGDEMAKISRFVQDLKTDATFAQAIRDLELGSVEKADEGGLEVTHFSLAGTLITSLSPPSP